MTPRLCKDCRYYDARVLGSQRYARCENHEVNKADGVYLTTGVADMFCQVARTTESLCGQDAKHFEPKENS